MYSIVFFGFVASILSVVKTQDNQVTIAMWVQAEEECLPKFPPEVKELLHDLKVKRVLQDNPSDDFKCLMDCIGKAIGVIDEQGVIHGERMKSLTSQALVSSDVTPEEINLAVEECSQVDHDIACEKTHLYVVCKHDKFKHVELHDDIKQSTAN